MTTAAAPLAAPPASAAAEDVPNFSKPRTRVAFRIDDDVFEAPPIIPAAILAEYASRFENMNASASVEAQMDAMTGVLALVLYPASYERFRERMASREEPIDLEQTQQAIEFLLEKYGMRPTRPSDASSDGSSSLVSGTPLTESTPVAG